MESLSGCGLHLTHPLLLELEQKDRKEGEGRGRGQGEGKGGKNTRYEEWRDKMLVGVPATEGAHFSRISTWTKALTASLHSQRNDITVSENLLAAI